jgi:hypothetical protein
LISNVLDKKNMPPFYENTCSLDELDEKPNPFEILKKWVTSQRIHLKNHLKNKLCSTGSKCFALNVGHM